VLSLAIAFSHHPLGMRAGRELPTATHPELAEFRKGSEDAPPDRQEFIYVNHLAYEVFGGAAAGIGGRI
jgi:hypothetical protein